MPGGTRPAWPSHVAQACPCVATLAQACPAPAPSCADLREPPARTPPTGAVKHRARRRTHRARAGVPDSRLSTAHPGGAAPRRVCGSETQRIVRLATEESQHVPQCSARLTHQRFVAHMQVPLIATPALALPPRGVPAVHASLQREERPPGRMIPGSTIERAHDLRALALYMEETRIGHSGTQMVDVEQVIGRLLDPDRLVHGQRMGVQHAHERPQLRTQPPSLPIGHTDGQLEVAQQRPCARGAARIDQRPAHEGITPPAPEAGSRRTGPIGFAATVFLAAQEQGQEVRFRQGADLPVCVQERLQQRSAGPGTAHEEHATPDVPQRHTGGGVPQDVGQAGVLAQATGIHDAHPVIVPGAASPSSMGTLARTRSRKARRLAR